MYNDSEGGKAGEKMGSFDVRITAHGDKYGGAVSELPALRPHEESGFFFLIIRLYDPDPLVESAVLNSAESAVKSGCYGEGLGENEEEGEAKKWGWTCPPVIKRTNGHGELMSLIPYCGMDRQKVRDEATRSDSTIAGSEGGSERSESTFEQKKKKMEPLVGMMQQAFHLHLSVLFFCCVHRFLCS